ncbi:MAG: phenylalanine 4-monooxygenase [Acidobacteria bacterium]|nr:phenylalanine 4-monooxygenase [Acidobacteriota bacterium]MCA1639415.1 phenylalanine 4-monooxygenase [Acidobacteriota bacterium]
MITTTKQIILQDHVDGRMVMDNLSEQEMNRSLIVHLDPDHPGFRDKEYRARRNQIAQIALDYNADSPIPDAPYTDQEHEVWRLIWEAVEPAHERHACVEYLECVKRLDLPQNRIPQLYEVSAKVEAISGFRLEPVAGLVEPRVFLESLANGVFLSTQYIRHYSTPLYTPEPDVAHEIIGHAITLADERLAEINRLVGEAVKRTKSDEAMERLARAYWFTIEFGVLRQNGKVKAYGTGLLSSAGELEVMHKAELRSLDLEAAAHQNYNPTTYQPVLFCANSFEEMYDRLKDYLICWR